MFCVESRFRRLMLVMNLSLATLLAAAPGLADAQDNPAAPQAASMPEPGGQPPAPASTSFSRAELEKLLAPIALFPDSLLAQILPASAYPIQIVQAQRWLDQNAEAIAKNDYSGVDSTSWDPAVKALTRFPDVIKKMSAKIDWTTDLGDAFVNQPKDVADVIQDLARQSGTGGQSQVDAATDGVEQRSERRERHSHCAHGPLDGVRADL